MEAQQEQMNVELCDDPIAWDEFVRENDGPPFTTWGWGDVVESLGHDRYFLSASVDGDITGVVPLFHVRSRLFGDELVSVPFADYGSLVLDDNHWEASRDRLLANTRALADKLDVDRVSLRNRDLGSVESYEHKQRYVSYSVPLSGGPDAVWDRMSSSRQNHIRQAEKEGVEVRLGEDKGDLEEFYHLYLLTMRGHGSPPHSYGFFERLWEQFHDETMKLFLAEYEGTAVNATISFAFGSRVYEWKNVSDYDYRDLDGGSLIEWKEFEWGSENGYETAELGRTREGSGVETFKKSFGGEKVRMDDYHYSPSGQLDLVDPDEEKYESLERLWRRVPLPLTRIIGPHIRKSITL